MILERRFRSVGTPGHKAFKDPRTAVPLRGDSRSQGGPGSSNGGSAPWGLQVTKRSRILERRFRSVGVPGQKAFKFRAEGVQGSVPKEMQGHNFYYRYGSGTPCLHQRTFRDKAAKVPHYRLCAIGGFHRVRDRRFRSKAGFRDTAHGVMVPTPKTS